MIKYRGFNILKHAGTFYVFYQHITISFKTLKAAKKDIDACLLEECLEVI